MNDLFQLCNGVRRRRVHSNDKSKVRNYHNRQISFFGFLPEDILYCIGQLSNITKEQLNYEREKFARGQISPYCYIKHEYLLVSKLKQLTCPCS